MVRSPKSPLLPARLKQGDLIAVYSPSSSVPSFFPERLNRAEGELRRLGFRVRRGQHVMARTGYTAGTAEERAAEFDAAVLDAEVRAIHCSIGGNNCNQLLDMIDYDAVRNNPKVIVGYSNSTALLVAVWQMTGLVTYHGPGVLPEFGEYPGIMDYTERSFLDVLCNPQSPRPLTHPPTWTDEYAEWGDPENWDRARSMSPGAPWRTVAQGVGRGPLVGGNLETLVNLAGTHFWPNLDNAIFFWEAAGETVANADAYLTQLRQMGIFDQISGMLVGKPRGVAASVGVELAELVDARFSKAKFPVLADVDFGHTDPQLTLPIGIEAQLATDGAQYELSLLEPSVA